MSQNFEQRDVRILREALAKIVSLRIPQISAIADNSLKRFAVAIESYCEHDETVAILNEGKKACLDCGKRLPLTTQLTLL